jgi:G-protein alpha subunit
MGVAEHSFDVNLHGKNVTWHLYDVGGARGQRHTWVPYFDDANAIIFVAPVSAFDQVRLLTSSPSVPLNQILVSRRRSSDQQD